MIHGKTLAFAATIPDIITIARYVIAATYATFQSFGIASVFFLCISCMVILAFKASERRWSMHPRPRERSNLGTSFELVANMNPLMVKDIHKQYGDTIVLKDISFSARKGDVISPIGSSGSGRNTLLRCINFLKIPISSMVQLDDSSLGGHPEHGAREVRSSLQRLRMRVAMVFQHFNLGPHDGNGKRFVHADPRRRWKQAGRV